jgi:hypothetical protein
MTHNKRIMGKIMSFIKLWQDHYDHAYVRATEEYPIDWCLTSAHEFRYKFERFRSVKDFLTKKKKNISGRDKKFILRFDKDMKKLGFYFHITYKGRIKYRKENKTRKTFFLEIMFLKEFISLELITRTNQMLQYRNYFDDAPDYIKELLANSYGGCANSIECGICKKRNSKNRDKVVKEKKCKYMAIYTIKNREIIKCCMVKWFEFIPIISELPVYVKLIKAFYK